MVTALNVICYDLGGEAPHITTPIAGPPAAKDLSWRIFAVPRWFIIYITQLGLSHRGGTLEVGVAFLF